MSNDQLKAILANIGGPRTCDRWARHWENEAQACAGDDRAQCQRNAQTLRLAARTMRAAPVVSIAGGSR